MKMLNNEKGIALITALLLTMLSLVMLMGVLYLLTRNVQVSAAHKRYKTALEATHGGADLFTKEVITKSITSATIQPVLDPVLDASFGRYTGCFQKKLNLPRNKWRANGCEEAATSVDPKVLPDVTFKLQGLPNQGKFKVYSKIVDSIPGNSDTSGYGSGLISPAGVAYSASGPAVSPQAVPAVYRVEVQGEREINPQEKARLTVLYAY